MFGGQNPHIDADHAVFQRLADAVNTANVAGVKVTGQAELGVVCGGYGFLLGLKFEYWCERAEGFFGGSQHVGGGVCHQRGFEKLAMHGLAAGQYPRAFGKSVGHMRFDFEQSSVFDQRAL